MTYLTPQSHELSEDIRSVVEILWVGRKMYGDIIQKSSRTNAEHWQLKNL